MSNEPIRSIMNRETGEIEYDIYPGDKVDIVRAETKEYLIKSGKNFNKEKDFVKLYDEVIPYLLGSLNGTELRYLLAMVQHVSYKDCILRRTNNNLSSPIRASEFCEIHGLNYNTGKRIFSSLKCKGVIAYVETGTILPEYSGEISKIYLVNPYIYFRGRDINDTVKSIFDKSGWREEILSHQSES